MAPRFPALALSAAILALLTVSSAWAQGVPPDRPPHGGAIEPMQPPKDLPRPQHGDRTRNLDFLFGALKAAPDADSAKQVENRIWALWLASGSDTANLLMSRVKTAIDGKDLTLALSLLDAVVELDPTYVEGWNRRATVHYMRKEFGQAMTDIRRVLALEPRRVSAHLALGRTLQDEGRLDEARACYLAAMALLIGAGVTMRLQLGRSLANDL